MVKLDMWLKKKKKKKLGLVLLSNIYPDIRL